MIHYKSVARLYKQQNIYICFQQTRDQKQKKKLFECNTYFTGVHLSTLVVTTCHSLRKVTSRFQTPSAQTQSHYTQSITMNLS